MHASDLQSVVFRVQGREVIGVLGSLLARTRGNNKFSRLAPFIKVYPGTIFGVYLKDVLPPSEWEHSQFKLQVECGTNRLASRLIGATSTRSHG